VVRIVLRPASGLGLLEVCCIGTGSDGGSAREVVEAFGTLAERSLDSTSLIGLGGIGGRDGRAGLALGSS
jgi:hypothetical protein